MSPEPPAGPSSTRWRLFAVCRPFLLCLVLFWIAPDDWLVLYRLLEPVPAF